FLLYPCPFPSPPPPARRAGSKCLTCPPLARPYHLVCPPSHLLLPQEKIQRRNQAVRPNFLQVAPARLSPVRLSRGRLGRPHRLRRNPSRRRCYRCPNLVQRAAWQPADRCDRYTSGPAHSIPSRRV